MSSPNGLSIACSSLESLGARITKSPMRVVQNEAELASGGYQDEGIIVPELNKSEPLSLAELKQLAVDLDVPDALRLVRVPQRTNEFIRALGRSGMVLDSPLGRVINGGRTSFMEGRPHRVNTTINPSTERYVGLHVDAMEPGEDQYEMMMGVVCAEGGRGLTVCPSITVDCVSEDLRCPKNPEERLERREQIRRAAALLQGSVVCYTLWLEGSDPKGDTYEAYANFQPHHMLHDGTTYRSERPAAIHLLGTGTVTNASFESII
jgi:hypothetical protein